MSRTATVSIGRRSNFGQKPNLPAGQWRRFQQDLRHVVESHSGEVFFAGLGSGAHPEFALEESYTVVFSIGQSIDANDDLCVDLEKLAAENYQDSIALTVGDTIFCEPKAVRPGWLYADGTSPLD